jgi:hypothetical protein
MAWEFEFFKIETTNEEEIPILGYNWKPTDLKPSAKGIDVNSIALRSMDSFSMDK